ncbi:MAG: endonuclease MutS2, partial [Bdellovibrionaceae bacterium]|nr:endonuclease MutS2 [Pseudobdellovibrionaceae bacterium]
MQELIALDWNEILLKIESFATSEAGRLRIRATAPQKSPEDAHARFTEISEASAVIAEGVRPFMQSLDLFATWFPRLRKKAILKTLEIKDVRSFCLESLALKESLSIIQNKWSEKMRSQLMEASEPLSAIDQILTPSGEIRSDASETLYNLFREKEKLAREVQTSLDRLVNDHQMEHNLQDKYVTTRDGRWVLPIKSGMQHYVPGVIHGSSHTKATVFMEPEKVIPLNNRLREIEVEIEDEIERLLLELSNYLHRQADEFQRSFVLLEEADVRFAETQFSGLIKGAPIEFSTEGFDLIEVRHPLLQIASVGSHKAVISNTVLLSPQKSILLLSGPNAGGKTVLLKSIGLAAQMARCGLPICANESSRVPFFTEILIGIGDSQSVDEELSTFA